MERNDKKIKNGVHLANEEKKTLPIFVKYGLIAVAIIAVVAIGLIIFFNSSGSTVATIDGVKISSDEFKYYLEMQKQSMFYEAYTFDQSITEATFWATKIDGEDAKVVAKKKATNLMRDDKIQYAKAKAANVSLTADETKSIDDWVNTNIVQQYGSGNKITANKNFTQQYGFSIDVLRQAQVENMTVQKFVSQEASKITDAEANVDKYYKSNPEWFKADTTYRTGGEAAIWSRHILFKFPENATQADKDAAKKKAEDVIARLKTGEDFAKLAKELSEDGSKDRGGDYLFGESASIFPEYRDATNALNPGQYTETPVMSSAGYHVIKVEEKYGKDQPVSLKCAKEYYEFGTTFIKYKLYEQKLDGWIKAADFKKNLPVYDSININPSTAEAPIK
ncbi:MAG TPA: peptidylprolyl isomerase [Clostridia bacterium]|nr:peptidylprolyl isomerase [Clostridia bacterium]